MKVIAIPREVRDRGPGADAAAESSAFDALAATYDASFTDSHLGRELRRVVWSGLDRLPIAGRRWLDLGCGTGEDALFLCRRGAEVLAVDASAAMLALARKKARAAGLEAAVLHWAQVDLNRPEALMSAAGRSTFDGALADFGSLNCVTDLSRLAAVLGELLAPGACLMTVTMGPFCVWETLGGLAAGRPRHAIRRWRSRRFRTRSGSCPLRYPAPATLARAVAPCFEVRQGPEALGLLLPPTDAGAFLRRRPAWLARLGRLEDRLRKLPGAAWGSDHYVMTFHRRTAEATDHDHEG